MTRKDPLVDLLIHDLTGPLSIVFASVNNLINKEEKYGPYNDYQKDTLKRILRNAGKAKGLLQEMVEVYRAEEGLFKKDRFLVEETLTDALTDAIEIIKPEIGEELAEAINKKQFKSILEKYGISLEMSGNYCATHFSHDQKKIRQIIRNLISNAMKYRNNMMKISVTGDLDLIISVEDDGPGIAKEKQDYIFKRFISLKDKENGPEGLGFGLSCVKNLIEMMKGEIVVKSSENAGSCFTVRIPPL